MENTLTSQEGYIERFIARNVLASLLFLLVFSCASAQAINGDGKSLRGQLAAKAIEAQLGFLFAVWDDAGTVSRTHVYYRGTFDVPASSDRGIRLIEIDAIEGLKIADPAIRSMLARYIRECSVDAFGVYVGNDVEDEVRPLARAGASAVNTGDQR